MSLLHDVLHDIVDLIPVHDGQKAELHQKIEDAATVATPEKGGNGGEKS